MKCNQPCSEISLALCCPHVVQATAPPMEPAGAAVGAAATQALLWGPLWGQWPRLQVGAPGAPAVCAMSPVFESHGGLGRYGSCA